MFYHEGWGTRVEERVRFANSVITGGSVLSREGAKSAKEE
jgi:hypothetical protein